MGNSFKYWLLVLAIAGFTYAVYSQGPMQGPPEPTMKDQQKRPSTGQGPCNRPDNPGQGSPPPPPPGLCLPINDYLLPLLLSGVALGAFSLLSLQRKQEINTSAP